VPSIEFGRNLENPAAIEIEGVEETGFVPLGIRIDLAERALLHKEGDFECSIMTPKAHAVAALIVAPALVWEVECHNV
jgi:hypothetical protein